jgi:hypothetical protein
LLATSIGVMMDERAMVELRECETKKNGSAVLIESFLSKPFGQSKVWARHNKIKESKARAEQ